MDELEQLKNRIGFKTAFSAVLGFYAAQFVATVMGLSVFALVGVAIYMGFKYL